MPLLDHGIWKPRVPVTTEYIIDCRPYFPLILFLATSDLLFFNADFLNVFLFGCNGSSLLHMDFL